MPNILSTYYVIFSCWLHQVPRLYLLSLTTVSIFKVFLIIFKTSNPNPPCQLSSWERTGENPRLSAECWQLIWCMYNQMFSRYQDLNPWLQLWEGCCVKQMSHRSPFIYLAWNIWGHCFATFDLFYKLG